MAGNSNRRRLYRPPAVLLLLLVVVLGDGVGAAAAAEGHDEHGAVRAANRRVLESGGKEQRQHVRHVERQAKAAKGGRSKPTNSKRSKGMKGAIDVCKTSSYYKHPSQCRKTIHILSDSYGDMGTAGVATSFYKILNWPFPPVIPFYEFTATTAVGVYSRQLADIIFAQVKSYASSFAQATDDVDLTNLFSALPWPDKPTEIIVPGAVTQASIAIENGAGKGDIAFISFGSNDLFVVVRELREALAMDPNFDISAFLQVRISPLIAGVLTATGMMAQTGATVFVEGVTPLQKLHPFFQNDLSPQEQALAASTVDEINGILETKVGEVGGMYLDFNDFWTHLLSQAASDGKNTADAMCGKSSTCAFWNFCPSPPPTCTEANAENFVFVDDVHPTGWVHRQFAEELVAKMEESGEVHFNPSPH